MNQPEAEDPVYLRYPPDQVRQVDILMFSWPGMLHYPLLDHSTEPVAAFCQPKAKCGRPSPPGPWERNNTDPPPGLHASPSAGRMA